MNLETAVKVWTLEAVAHDYAGFLVIDLGEELGRVFLQSKSELEPARKSMQIHEHTILKEVLL